MLTDLAVRKAVAREKPYKLSDGGGLYLLVTKAGQRCWRVDYRFGEKRATAALGVYPTVSLAEEWLDKARRKGQFSGSRGITPLLCFGGKPRFNGRHGQIGPVLVALRV
jgi:Arm DNA-binding domain